MAKILYALIAGGDTPLIEANLGASSNKYVRACRKILKKISRNELRRPDGMATLLSGPFAYNYIHGCDADDNRNNLPLESLVFLCVTEALPYAATPSETREAAFKFLSSNRRSFLEQFRGDLNILIKASVDSDTASIDSSNIFSIDPKMKSDLRMFSASMKDQMANLIPNDEEESDSDQFVANNNNINNDDDEKKMDPLYQNHRLNKNIKGYTDLRSNPPASGNKLYSPSSGSKFDQIIDHIESVKESVHHNIEMAMDRREDVALLQGKTDRLADESLNFKRRSRSVHLRYCRNLYKQRCVIASIVILILYLLSAMVCGWSWQSCS